MAKKKTTCVEVDRKALQSAVKRAADATSVKSPVTAYTAVQLVGSAGQLAVVGTDGLICSRTMLTADCQADFTEALAAKRLAAVAASLNGERVRIEFTEANAIIQSGGATFRLPLLEAGLPKAQVLEPVEDVPAGQLLHVLSAVKHASYVGEDRPQLSGVTLQIADGKATALATDGHRLGRASFHLTSREASFKALLTDRFVTGALALLGSIDPDGMVELFAAARHVEIRSDDRSIIGLVSDAGFPPYERAIPATVDTEAHLDVEALRTALRHAQLVDSDAHVVLSEAGCHVSAKQGEADVDETVVAEVMGPEVVFGVHAGYVLDAMASVGGPRVSFGHDSSSQTVVIKRLGHDGDDVCIVKPCRA